MEQAIAADVKIYLNGLRKGDVAQSDVQVWYLNEEPDKAAFYENDLSTFRRFLEQKGIAQPGAADLGLTIPKSQLADLLAEFDTRNCLLLQICYGLDKPIEEGGRLQLVNRGNYHLTSPDMTDEALKTSVYKVVINGVARTYFLLNLDRNQPISVTLAEAYKLLFRKLYGSRNVKRNPYIQGIALPVKAMQKVLDDPALFGNETQLTIQWGLTVYTIGTLGNLSLYIRAANPDNDLVVAYRTEKLTGPGMSDCPPKVPCQS